MFIKSIIKTDYDLSDEQWEQDQIDFDNWVASNEPGEE